ncbi:hypothetical protein [Nocardia macrotermitis]|uniref:hypothetical protein n=1 Tax=Nocardia macrotermitis TaxID=2585198 RepID=UPI001D0FF97F|nr:hypothetical protein [Nocardia macrotermitis]
MTARIGAVHLGWDVVSVAGGGGGTPIRPVQVEGTYTPPAYLLADASGRLHTAGADRGRSDLGIAVADVRDILGHKQIRIAGATWPSELVFRARLYNPLAAIGKYVRGKPDVIALPYPDDWPDEKIDEYARLVEELDVTSEPLPESVALSGYVRAIGLVRPPDAAGRATSATGVYSDGRMCLVVSVNGDDERPTESIGVPIAPDAMRDAHHADNVVIEVMAAARAIGADTSRVLLSGNVCFNDALRLAFQNHLGHRLHVADHPMHALVLGAAHLLVTDSEYADEEPDQGYGPEPARPGGPGPITQGPGHAVTPPRPDQGGPVDPGRQGARAPGDPGYSAQPPRPPAGTANSAVPEEDSAASGGGRHGWRGPEPTGQLAGARPGQQGPRHAAPDASEQTTAIVRDQVSNVHPGVPAMGGRVTRPPGSPADTMQTTRMGGDPAPRARHPAPPAVPQGATGAGEPGRVWNKVKDNLFGAPTIVGAVALALLAVHVGVEPGGVDRSGGVTASGVRPVTDPVVSAVRLARVPEDCQGMPNARATPGPGGERATGCDRFGIDNLHYLVPNMPADLDQGPPLRV